MGPRRLSLLPPFPFPPPPVPYALDDACLPCLPLRSLPPGLALLNATPFWAFREPARRAGARGSGAEVFPRGSGGVSQNDDLGAGSREAGVSYEGDAGGAAGGMLGWDGTLPAPKGLFRFGAWYFDRMRDPRTVKAMLGGVYSNPGSCGRR